MVIGKVENGRHHSESDDEFRQQRDPRSMLARNRDHIADRGVGKPLAQESSYQHHTESGSSELRRNIEAGVPTLDFAKTKEGQGHRGIDVRSRLISPR